MAEAERHVLVVGADKAGVERVAPMLRRAEFNVHTAHPSQFLLDLVLGTSFELLIVGFPLEELPIDDLIAAVREEGSACRDAGLLLLAETDFLDDAQALVDLGVNRAISADWVDARLWQAIGDLLHIAPRVYMRVLLHADIDVSHAQERTIFQTVNVSASGLLLQGTDELSLGGVFEFLFRLPGGGLIEGTAEVVRRSNPMREGFQGVGTRFLEFRNGGEDRLHAYIDLQSTRGSRK